MNRLPIRLRLTLPFAVAMAAVLAATGAFVYFRVGGALLSSLDANLVGQAQEAVQRANAGRGIVDPDSSEGPVVVSIERSDGSVVATSRPGLVIPLRRESGHATYFTTGLPGLKGEWRVIEQPATVQGRPAIVAVARSLASREETLHRLAREFAFAAPAALLLAIVAGYLLAAAALRPVEAMRRRAASISAAEPGRRLPVPEARDELQALAVTLNDMLERLERAFEHERRFLSDASHELRTPLTLLRAELELALRRPRSRAELERALRSAAEDTERLSLLADDLLLLAQADQGRLPIRPVRVEATDLLDRVRQRFEIRAAEQGRMIRVVSNGEAELDADPVRVGQALENLVANAFDHGEGTITLRGHTENGHVELHVTDEGPGFPYAFLDRAFDRFSRADDARTAGGTGLGLAIVELIARAHGGEAHVANRPEGGSDAWISLPRTS